VKAITISQPYASLIASGAKWVENRIWETSHRGRIAIHAGHGTQYLSKNELKAGGYPTGKVVAVANLVACVSIEEVRIKAASDDRKRLIKSTSVNWSEVERHSHCSGPWCWILANVRTIEPIDVRGAQRIWNVPAEIAERIEAVAI
jgi:hypothetical protein